MVIRIGPAQPVPDHNHNVYRETNDEEHNEICGAFLIGTTNATMMMMMIQEGITLIITIIIVSVLVPRFFIRSLRTFCLLLLRLSRLLILFVYSFFLSFPILPAYNTAKRIK